METERSLVSILEVEVYFNESKARFYAAEMVLLIEELHNKGIVHRDITSESFHMDNKFHLILTDSELAKSLNVDDRKEFKPLRTRIHVPDKLSIIGVPDYKAPEEIKGVQTYNGSEDWWALGVLIYEMLVGIPPFRANTLHLIFRNILNCSIEWPTIGYGEGYITPEAKDLIEKLLVSNPRKRLGYHGVQELKAHPFFQGIDWENIRQMGSPAPEVNEGFA